MFSTVDLVQSLTGYTVTLEKITQAQAIIESYVGRSEMDINYPADRAIMEKAVSYQAAYLAVNSETVYEQVGVKQVSQSDGMITVAYENDAPFIAPLAHMATRRLSWRNTRSVKVGPVFDVPATSYADRWARD